MRIEKLQHNGTTIYNVDTVENREHLVSLGVDVEALEAEMCEAEAKAESKMNADYNGVSVSLTSMDAMGLLQVQSAFFLGVESTKFVFANGTVMTLEKESFVEFATWFSIERNKLFV